MKTQIRMMVLSAIVCFSGGASAALIQLEAAIDGAQANQGQGTGSPATGSAQVTFDDVSNLFSWNISWTELLGDLTVAHFHGPAAPGTNAGVEVDFLSASPTNPSIGSTTISPDQAAGLLSELWYVNIHSSFAPGGEIRGQVLLVNQVPLPATIALIALGLLGVRRASAAR